MAVTTQKPKYIQLADDLRERIRSGELTVGERLPSYSEMRAQFGASTATMQRVFDVLSQEQLIERRHSSGIYVAEPRRILTRNIGIIGSRAFRAQRDFSFVYLNQSIQGAAVRHERRLTLLGTDRDWNPESFKLVDGLLLSGHRTETNREIVRQKPALMPCVSLFVIAEGMTSVVADDYSAAEFAVRHLQELGHRRIGCLMEKRFNTQQVQRDRFAGYRDALLKTGDAQEHRMRLIDADGQPPQQSFLEWGREQMRAWLEEGWRDLGCTAILAQNDQAAIGVMQVLCEAKIDVPSEVSVMGFDGTELCDHATPRLTSMQMPLEQMGAKAVDLLIEQIGSGRTEEQVIVLPAKLRAGNSVASVSVL